ncbi:MAG TPA: aquaporin [Thermoleophilaceae bacterium]|nr:aquaporin [Thermoleophilaceae bacterium]
MRDALRRHWPEYLMEAAGLGVFMIAACLFGTLLEHPDSTARQALPDAGVRRMLMGLAMGGTAAGLIYSPWGRRSGAHLNPSVTLTFLRLGKVKPEDAAFYATAQALGGVLGVVLSALLLQGALAHPAVSFVATVPGPAGPWVAFAAEAAISFGLILTVLAVSSSRHARLTGLAAAVLVAAWITFEAPFSGMSMNPARTVASALPSGIWTGAWIYFLAPPLGMLLAAETFGTLTRWQAQHCAKLDHARGVRCIFCEASAA